MNTLSAPARSDNRRLTVLARAYADARSRLRLLTINAAGLPADQPDRPTWLAVHGRLCRDALALAEAAEEALAAAMEANRLGRMRLYSAVFHLVDGPDGRPSVEIDETPDADAIAGPPHPAPGGPCPNCGDSGFVMEEGRPAPCTRC